MGKLKRIYFAVLLVLSTHLVVQAQTIIDHWETAIYGTDDWHYFIGDTEPPSTWNSTAFNDDSWDIGAGSIGYGDEDDNTLIAPTASVYMRQTFTVSDPTKIEMAMFHADYDDGFVAYLNGVEIARRNVEGNPPAHNAWATTSSEAWIYQWGTPETFFIVPDVVAEILLPGQNVLSVQTHNFQGASSSDLTAAYWLSFGIGDESVEYGSPPLWFVSPEIYTHLPIVKINTFEETIPDEPKIDAQMGIVWNGEGQMNSSLDTLNEFFGNIGIELRGQSSLSFFPKNNYGLELRDENGDDMDAAFLNFPEEEDFILHGPYSDKTLMRNVLTMNIARSMGQYASRTRFVELVINEEYQGVYVMMERIKRDKNRVDIAKLKDDDIEGDELTGGYVFKIDKATPEEVDWYSEYGIVGSSSTKLAFQYVSPNRDQIEPEQAAYIKAYVDSFEVAMSDPSTTYGGKRYDEYLDVVSFAEHFIISELTKNVDAYRISSYMHKDKDSNGGLIKAGPVWDFNIAYANSSQGCGDDSYEGWMYGCAYGNPFWWDNLIEDEVFANTLKCRWQEAREGALHLDTLYDFIDEQTALLGGAIAQNFNRWPVLSTYVWPNAVVLDTYEEEVNYLKEFLANRIAWMDENIPGMCATSIEDSFLGNSRTVDFTIATNGRLATVQFLGTTRHNEQTWTLQLQNSLGQICHSERVAANSQQISVDVGHLPKGIYFARLQSTASALFSSGLAKQFVIVGE